VRRGRRIQQEDAPQVQRGEPLLGGQCVDHGFEHAGHGRDGPQGRRAALAAAVVPLQHSVETLLDGARGRGRPPLHASLLGKGGELFQDQRQLRHREQRSCRAAQ